MGIFNFINQQQRLAFDKEQAKHRNAYNTGTLDVSRDRLGLDQKKYQQGLIAKPEPTGLMQNIFSMGYQQGTPEYKDLMGSILRKPQTQINMGSKHITASDAQQMRNSKGEMPPIGSTWQEAGRSGYNFVSPQQLTEARKESETLGAMGSALDTYEGIVKETGAMLPSKRFTDPNKFNELTSAYAALQLEFKELAKLGVLAGPDMELIERVIQDPTSMSANAQQFFSKENPTISQLGIVRKKLDEARKRAEQRHGKDWRANQQQPLNPTQNTGKPWERQWK